MTDSYYDSYYGKCPGCGAEGMLGACAVCGSYVCSACRQIACDQHHEKGMVEDDEGFWIHPE